MELQPLTRVVFNPILHSYLLDNEKVLKGVTTLMSEHGLSASLSGIPKKYVENAATRGTAIHQMLENYDNGLTVIPQDVVSEDGEILATQEEMSKVLKQYKTFGLKVLHSEWLVSDCDMIASSIDKVVATDVEDEFILGDVKTTSEKHFEQWAWQLSIYATLFERQHQGTKVVKLQVYHMRHNKKAEIYELPRVPENLVEDLFEAERNGVPYVSNVTEKDVDKLAPFFNDEANEVLLLFETRAQLATKLKELNKMLEPYEEKLYNGMIEAKRYSLTCNFGKFYAQTPYYRPHFDSSRLKAEHPEIYEKYNTPQYCKGSITFRKK